jgi:hypothetical protein
MTRKQGVLRRALSLLEGPVDALITRAKAWNAPAGLDLTQDPTRTFRSMRNLRNIYLQGAYIAEGVDLFPLYAFGAGYELEIDEEKGDGEKAKKDVEEILTKLNFFDVQWMLSVDAEVVRDGIAEIVMGNGTWAGKPVNVVPRPAECFEFDTDEKGRITSFTQKFDNRGNSITQIPLKPEQVLHYQFMSRPDSPYGVSIVERVVHDINRDTKVAEAITAGICLHGTPKWHIKANSTQPDRTPLTDTEFTDLEKQFEKFNAKDQFITEGDVVVQALDTAGVQNVQMYSDVTLIRVVAGMGIPGELLGLRQGTTDATAVSRVGAFLRKIKSCQRDIESLWNLNIIDRITGVPGLVKLRLNDPNPEDFVQIAAAIAQLRAGGDETVAPWQWCRERLKIPTNEELGIDEPEPRPKFDPAQMGLQNFMRPPQEDQQIPGDEGMSKQELDATKEMAAAAHELSQIVRKASGGA